MKIFISYSSPDRATAERLTYSLRDDGHTVFFDRSSLPAGEGYDSRIRRAINKCDLFIYLISSASISPGSYTLTELGIAQKKWNKPSGHMLPVVIGDVDLEQLPPYLLAVTVLHTQGNSVAEVIATVNDVQLRRNQKIIRVITASATSLLLLLSLAYFFSDVLFTEDQIADLPPVLQNIKPVALRGTLSNAGWMLVLDIIEKQPIKEVFYKIDDEPAFQSTGFSRNRDHQTGLRQANLVINAGNLHGKHTFKVKYTRTDGTSKGPYTLNFDSDEEIVKSHKEILKMTKNSWLAFREYPKGHMLVYFSHLLSYKNSLQEIQYSVDEDSLSQRVKFAPHRSAGTSRIDENDQLYIEVPMSAREVFVKVVFIDGTEWPMRKFIIAETL